MSLKSAKRITRYSWDALPMPDTVIDRVNALGKNQPELLTFTDRKGRLIGDVELTGVDGDESEAPREVENNNLDELFDEDDAEAIPDLVDRATPQQVDAEVATVGDDEPAQVPEAAPVAAPEDNRVEDPVEIPEVRKSTRVKFQTREPYVPSMTSAKYMLWQ